VCVQGGCRVRSRACMTCNMVCAVTETPEPAAGAAGRPRTVVGGWLRHCGLHGPLCSGIQGRPAEASKAPTCAPNVVRTPNMIRRGRERRLPPPRRPLSLAWKSLRNTAPLAFDAYICTQREWGPVMSECGASTGFQSAFQHGTRSHARTPHTL
jgi:hypothetical protein